MKYCSPLPLSLVIAVFGGGLCATASLTLGGGLLLALLCYSLGGALTLVLSALALSLRYEKLSNQPSETLNFVATGHQNRTFQDWESTNGSP